MGGIFTLDSCLPSRCFLFVSHKRLRKKIHKFLLNAFKQSIFSCNIDKSCLIVLATYLLTSCDMFLSQYIVQAQILFEFNYLFNIKKNLLGKCVLIEFAKANLNLIYFVF